MSHRKVCPMNLKILIPIPYSPIGPWHARAANPPLHMLTRATPTTTTTQWNSSAVVTVLLSDNGGADKQFTGANAPLSGGKDGLWEGGVRTTALIHAPGRLPARAAGATYGGLFYVADWFATLLHVATNGEWSAAERPANRRLPLDAVDHWDALAAVGPAELGGAGTNANGAPRTKLSLRYDPAASAYRYVAASGKLFKLIVDDAREMAGADTMVVTHENAPSRVPFTCRASSVPSLAPTPTPTTPSCADDPAWYKTGRPDNDCDWVASQQTRRRCRMLGQDGTRARQSCRVACDTC